MDPITKALNFLFGTSTTTLEKGKEPVTQTQPNIIQRIQNALSGYAGGGEKPIQQYTPTPVPTPIQQYSSGPNYDEIERKMRSGLTQYGGENLPALTYVPQIMDAIRKYPFLAQNPYIPAQQMILESSGGRNITRPNNPTNWGIGVPGNNEAFQNMTVADVLDLYLSGLGERSSVYDPYRTGSPLTPDEIKAFAQTYEPANRDYPRALLEGLKYFESQ